jgi:hypothetical protein
MMGFWRKGSSLGYLANLPQKYPQNHSLEEDRPKSMENSGDLSPLKQSLPKRHFCLMLYRTWPSHEGTLNQSNIARNMLNMSRVFTRKKYCYISSLSFATSTHTHTQKQKNKQNVSRSSLNRWF